MEIPAWADDVLAFWFGDGRAARAEWFTKSEAFDREVGTRFGGLIEQALAGGPQPPAQGWAGSAPASLARIVLLDQFTRNVFRDTPRAFAGDALALAAARAMVTGGQDLTLPRLQRAFVYLPYQHAEDLGTQDEGVALFARLAAEDGAFTDNLEWARRHREVIARFGRFPHRNAILGRASNAEETAFLLQPGSRF
jgi:uncharacterized protein (DUF924 family)